MLYHGSRRRAEDLDIVGTADAHGAFLEGARGDERFSVMSQLPERVRQLTETVGKPTGRRFGVLSDSTSS